MTPTTRKPDAPLTGASAPQGTGTPKPPRPLWVPPGVKLEDLPEELRYAIEAILGPAYQELVLQAPTAQERMAGLTYVHLAWLELFEQVMLWKKLDMQAPSWGRTKEDEGRIGLYVRIVAAKDRAAKFHLELQKYREKLEACDPLRRGRGAGPNIGSDPLREGATPG